MVRGKLVYSTDPNWKKNEDEVSKERPSKTGPVYLQRVSKGRSGKTVTLITGLSGNLKNWKKELQQLCGAGGTVKGDTVEIQGDHRQKIAEFLNKRGFKTKFSGG